MHIAAVKLHIDQVADDRVQKTFPLVLMADREAAECIPEAAPRPDYVIVLVIHRAGVVQIRVSFDTFLIQQPVDLGKGIFVTGIDLGNSIF